MIIVQTPLRISLLGGGTDFQDFYAEHGGAVISTGIDKCVFVIIKERFDDQIYVNYSKKEIVDSVDKIEHDLVREAMKLVGVERGVEITNLADIPTRGTGLGSSSSFTVALLQALHTYKGESVTSDTLAREACQIEIEILGAPIGKQDQYIASYGGLRFISFNVENGNDNITAERIHLNGSLRSFDENFLLFYTGVTRNANSILLEQKSNIKVRSDILLKLRDLAYSGRDSLISGELDAIGELMNESWELKKMLASKITNVQIDQIYDIARKSGAIGGKITGAGGGGFLLLFCPKDKKDCIRTALHGLKELPFHFERDGSKVIFNYRRV